MKSPYSGNHRRAIIYARVSSDEQEKEGFSIPAQLKLLHEYPASEGFSVAEEYVDVETASFGGLHTFELHLGERPADARFPSTL